MIFLNKSNLRNLYPVECSRQVLGGILNNINLINDYNIEVEDFYANNHKIIFATIQNMIKSGITQINDFVIKDYLEKNNEKWLEKFIKFNEDMNFIEQIKMKYNNNFNYHYTRLKKFSLLRDFYKSNIDINEIYDISNVDKELNIRFEELTENEIIDFFSKKILNIRDKRQVKNDARESFKVGEGLRELKRKYKKDADFGYPLPNKVINYIVRGQRKGTVSLLSGTSGSGKSRNLYNQAVYTASPFIFSTEKNKWVANGTKEKVLVISTELSKEEIQGIFLAIISGVPQDKILENTYTEEEENRIDKAIEILEDTELYCEYISDFNMQEIEIILERYIINHDVQYLYFDYIHETPALLMETGKMGNLRADQSLFLFGAKLKELARVHNVYIASGTQMNRTYKNNTDSNLDATSIRGAMSLSDKIDIGIILTIPVEKEKEEVKNILEAVVDNGNFVEDKEPNIVYTIYKNRGGKLKGVKVFCHTNLGNMQEEVLCLTNEALKPIKKLEIKDVIVPNIDNYKEILDYLNDGNEIGIF